MPPRHGKSEFASKYFPAWFIGTFPEKRVILASYEADFAAGWGRKVRDLLTEYGQEHFGVSVRSGSSSASRWDLEGHAGGMDTAGVGGPITGKGAHLLIIDDPVKNAEEANSETLRNKAWDWYVSTAYTRLEPGGVVVLIQCMTGDTPVLMESGDEKPLRDIRPGDRVATYENGKVSVSKVSNWINNGPDRVYEISMKSGIIVKANERHPFLVDEGGETKWQRTAKLKKGSVILRVIGANGRELNAQKKGATSQPNAKACACRTTANIDGKSVFGHLRSIPGLGVKRICVIATKLASRTMNVFCPRKAAFVPSASSFPTRKTPAHIGTASSASIIATKAKGSGGFSVTTAILQSVTERLKRFSSPLPSTYEITRDTVVDVVEKGVEDVFDVEIERTENFIANGLVSHNTRWHEDDLAGRVIEKAKQTGEAWDILNLPAIALENDAAGRKPGEALWPERYDLERLQEIEKTVGPYWFSALFQQTPQPHGGGFFKWDWFKDHMVEALPVNAERVRYWDTAGTEGGGDWTVGTLVSRDERGIFTIEDVVRGQWSPNRRDSMIRETAYRDGLAPAIWLEKEAGVGGTDRSLATIKLLAGFNVHTEPVTGSKEHRAEPFASQAEAGNVKVFRADWNHAWLTELCSFPFGKHDDQVDATSGAFNRLALDPDLTGSWGANPFGEDTRF